MEEQKLTIPTQYLPDNWRFIVGNKFNLQPNMIGKVANGTRKNVEVFDHLLALAEAGKAEYDAVEKLRLDRLKQLKTINK